jgi:hypothetical protein
VIEIDPLFLWITISPRHAFPPHRLAAPCAPTPSPRLHSWQRVFYEWINVHHIIPFDIAASCGRPDLELDFRNLITLCEGVWNHHHVVGHFGDWQSYNRHVRSDAKRPECMGQPGEKIRKMAWWAAEHQDRPEHARSAAPSDKADMKALLDRMFPPL